MARQRPKVSESKFVAVDIQLESVDDTDLPVFSNFCRVIKESDTVYLDFGFLDPDSLNALPNHIQSRENIAVTLTGQLAVRVVVGFETLVALHQQIGGVIDVPQN